jgi:hypothetical protein
MRDAGARRSIRMAGLALLCVLFDVFLPEDAEGQQSPAEPSQTQPVEQPQAKQE